MEANPERNKPHLKVRKFIHLPAQWVNVPRYVIEDLIRQSQGAVLSNLDGFIISNGSVSLPRKEVLSGPGRESFVCNKVSRSIFIRQLNIWPFLSGFIQVKYAIPFRV